MPGRLTIFSICLGSIVIRRSSGATSTVRFKILKRSPASSTMAKQSSHSAFREHRRRLQASPHSLQSSLHPHAGSLRSSLPHTPLDMVHGLQLTLTHVYALGRDLLHTKKFSLSSSTESVLSSFCTEDEVASVMYAMRTGRTRDKRESRMTTCRPSLARTFSSRTCAAAAA